MSKQNVEWRVYLPLKGGRFKAFDTFEEAAAYASDHDTEKSVTPQIVKVVYEQRGYQDW